MAKEVALVTPTPAVSPLVPAVVKAMAPVFTVLSEKVVLAPKPTRRLVAAAVVARLMVAEVLAVMAVMVASCETRWRRGD